MFNQASANAGLCTCEKTLAQICEEQRLSDLAQAEAATGSENKSQNTLDADS